MPETTVTCPHCGDTTRQDVVLNQFTCGECDEPFSAEEGLHAAWVIETRRQIRILAEKLGLA